MSESDVTSKTPPSGLTSEEVARMIVNCFPDPTLVLKKANESLNLIVREYLPHISSVAETGKTELSPAHWNGILQSASEALAPLPPQLASLIGEEGLFSPDTVTQKLLVPQLRRMKDIYSPHIEFETPNAFIIRFLHKDVELSSSSEEVTVELGDMYTFLSFPDCLKHTDFRVQVELLDIAKRSERLPHHIHPHVSAEGSLCMGSSTEHGSTRFHLKNALKAGMIEEAARVLDRTLRTYIASQAYGEAQLRDWGGLTCRGCGEPSLPDDLLNCSHQGCIDGICTNCALFYCEECGTAWCNLHEASELSIDSSGFYECPSCGRSTDLEEETEEKPEEPKEPNSSQNPPEDSSSFGEPPIILSTTRLDP